MRVCSVFLFHCSPTRRDDLPDSFGAKKNESAGRTPEVSSAMRCAGVHQKSVIERGKITV